MNYCADEEIKMMEPRTYGNKEGEIALCQQANFEGRHFHEESQTLFMDFIYLRM